MRRRVRILGAALGVLAASCTGCLQSGAGGNTVAMIPGYRGASATAAAAQPSGLSRRPRTDPGHLGRHLATQMSIDLSQAYAPAGKVTS